MEKRRQETHIVQTRCEQWISVYNAYNQLTHLSFQILSPQMVMPSSLTIRHAGQGRWKFISNPIKHGDLHLGNWSKTQQLYVCMWHLYKMVALSAMNHKLGCQMQVTNSQPSSQRSGILRA